MDGTPISNIRTENPVGFFEAAFNNSLHPDYENSTQQLAQLDAYDEEVEKIVNDRAARKRACIENEKTMIKIRMQLESEGIDNEKINAVFRSGKDLTPILERFNRSGRPEPDCSHIQFN